VAFHDLKLKKIILNKKKKKGPTRERERERERERGGVC